MAATIIGATTVANMFGMIMLGGMFLDRYGIRKTGFVFSALCALGGIEVRYPMLDEGVVEHSTRIPSILKLPARQLRGFYKKAAEGFLPEDCAERFESRADLSYNHLIAVLQQRMEWNGVSILLTGFAPVDDPRLREIEERALAAIQDNESP